MLVWLIVGVALIGVLILGTIPWIRSLPVPADRYHATAEMRPPGDYPSQGGLMVVRDLDDPQAALARLAEVAQGWERTVPLSGSAEAGHASFVSRSRIMGFPDVTNMWVADGRLAARAHLVMGRGDMGVNGRRLRSWLDAAGIS